MNCTLYKKKVVVVAMLLIVMGSLAGCSQDKNNQKKENNWKSFFVSISNTRSTTNTVQHIDKDYVKPAIGILDKYLQEEKTDLKVNPKPETYTKLAKDNVKNLETLKALRAELQKEDVLKMTDHYIFFSRLYLDRAIQRLDTVQKIAAADKTKKQGLINSLRHIDGRLLVEAKYGYENSYNKFTKGEETYQLVSRSYWRIKKGNSYEQIMNYFRMPGEFMPGYTVVNNGKKEYHNPVVWEDNGKYVYVDFVNGKANSWRANELEGFKCK